MRCLPVWSLAEVEAARQHIFISQTKSDVAARFSRWGGTPRFILQLPDTAHQAMLQEALASCSLGEMINSMTNICSATEISRRLVHLTVDAQYLEGPAQFASEWVKEQLIGRYVQSRSRKVCDFLRGSGGGPAVADLRRKLWERHVHEAFCAGATFACRNLQGLKRLHCELQPCSSGMCLCDMENITQLLSKTYGFGKNRGCGCRCTARQALPDHCLR